jgi:diguanylate cyclase (GGDEF)-like protein
VARVAVFASSRLRRSLRDGEGLRFVEAEANAPPKGCQGAVVELRPGLGGERLDSLRAALGGAPLGSVSRSTSAAALQRSAALGFDFHVACDRPGLQRELKARLQVARAQPRGGGGFGLAVTRERLQILTDIVKTANSILEPDKLIDVIMGKIQVLIPSEAWSILLVDETRSYLSFALALGDKSSPLAKLKVKMGEGIAGWVAQSGESLIVNDVHKDPRFASKFDHQTQFHTRSILCAPLVSRGRSIGVVEVLNKRGGDFSQADLELLMTLVEPCAIAIENAQLFQRAEQLTVTDDLTRLFNSRYLTLYLERELTRCRRHGIPLSLVFLDLDGFKAVNDLYGHLAGSATLTEVGRILTDTVRESDTLARYGGDEFVVVLPETPSAGALVIAERIRKAIEAHDFLAEQGLSVHISASFGIACFPDHAQTPEGLVQKADQAMYRVKEANKNGVQVAR